MTDKALEAQFHQEMLTIYHRAKAECGYQANYFLNMVNADGGLPAARQLIATAKIPDGLTKLCMLGRLDLSMEALMRREPWRALFTASELAIAESRLKKLGYKGK